MLPNLHVGKGEGFGDIADTAILVYGLVVGFAFEVDDGAVRAEWCGREYWLHPRIPESSGCARWPGRGLLR